MDACIMVYLVHVGVYQHAHFLRDVSHASAIRSTIIQNLGLASTPGRTQQHRQGLLHIVVVGGGPTGVEVAGEIVDFVDNDIKRLYPELARDMKVTLVEANEILASFDVSLREYTAQHLQRSGVKLVKVHSSLLVQIGRVAGSVKSCMNMCSAILSAMFQAFSTAGMTHLITLCNSPLIQVLNNVCSSFG